MIARLIHFIWKVVWNTTVILVCAGLIFIGLKINQPMSIPDAPDGMTYFKFMQDRIDAVKTVEPSRCGWGMILSLAALGPIYSVVYTVVAINPEGTLAKITASDPDIPKDVEGLIGTKSQESGGVWLRDYPGRCLVNQPVLDVNLGQ